MSRSYFCCKTIDDVMHEVLEELLDSGKIVNSEKGESLELMGVILEIENPRARLSRTENRGKPFSCLGELLWYLSKRKSLEFIGYYIRAYRDLSEDGEIWGGYGPRLFDWEGINQFENIVSRLKKKPSTRKAVIQLWDRADLDLDLPHKDVPCTCTFQFFVRDNLLHMLTSMRSNDIYVGFPHDVFCFTMLQEILARTLGLEIGTYKHSVGSLHLYTKNIEGAKIFLEEGWQSTLNPMPPMPLGDPWPAISQLLETEEAIRLGGIESTEIPMGLHEYWADLIRILQLFRCCVRVKDPERAKVIEESMHSSVYKPFIAQKMPKIS